MQQAWLNGRMADVVFPALLGVLATFAFAPFGYWFLLLFALAALMVLIWAQRPARAFWRAFVYALAHFLSGIYWIYISTHVYGGVPAWLGLMLVVSLNATLALFVAVPVYVCARWLSADKALWALLGLPSALLLGELLRSFIGTGFPWLSLGYAWIDTPVSRMAPVFGVYGLSFLIAVLAGCVWMLLTGSLQQRTTACCIAGLLMLIIMLSPAPDNWTEPVREPISTAMVQGNIPQDLKWRSDMRLPTLTHYQQMTRQITDARLIVWPEVALPVMLHEVRDDYLPTIDREAKAKGASVVVGLLEQHEQSNDMYNIARVLGVDQGHYRKRHLVPFGEYFPVPDFVMGATLSVTGLEYSDFTHGPADQPPLVIAGETIGLSICFEDVFGDEIALAMPEASILMNITNDAWFADSLAPHQHLQIARMRALENGREIIRVANTGISAHIAADGEIRQRTEQFETKILSAMIQPRAGLTPYARWRDGPLWIFAPLMLVLVFLIGRKRLA